MKLILRILLSKLFCQTRLRPLTIISIFLLIQACSPKLKDIEAPIENPNMFSNNGKVALPEKWWHSFEDPQLNQLIDEALANNFNLTSAWHRMIAANAIRKRTSTNLLPILDLGAQTAVSRPEPDFAGGENTQLGGTVSYEVDLWGRIRASVDAEEFRANASYYDYQAIAMSLSAEIARTWFQLVTLKKQLQLSKAQIKTNEKAIRLIRIRFGGGQIKGVDILRQRQLLEQTKELQIIYETNLALLKNQLAVLTGVPAQNYELEVAEELPDLPALPQTGLPLELIRRRPDILREYNTLLALDRDMAAAVANKFPRLSFNVTAQARSNTYSELFNNWAYTLRGNLFGPLLYWGRLRAEVTRTEAVKNEQLYQYGQAVLTAFREVEDALIQEKNQQKRIDILTNRVAMAEKVNDQLQIEFTNGGSNYLDVLLSLSQQQQLQRDLLDALQEQYEIRIALYRAIAGDFKTEREQAYEGPIPKEN
ncbi:efflux transporter outer membrane subunit [Aquimarina brevivitae]|uniref:NodT family efflux transporter outer membrane factor (OMF) lipoprotein n=1 Tax=Aquimarina brevivitae TaxID=323412 RepID=A0A4Q7P1C5_9FLAO|nr:efflux transporter outer membrane subunit [Aquimarina brevivitae]RZS93636.1 NodT family efflux transporter outer membrane factor (OMF) lipoprotein [Aquimarina brevivitae]